LLNEPER